MSIIKRGKYWHIKVTINGQTIRKSTKNSNKRAAEQIEAALKVELAKGEAGIRKKMPAPTLREFLTGEFQSYIEASFSAKLKTYRYYMHGIKASLGFERLADARMDTITGDQIAAYASKRFADGLQVTSVNRELQVLRRALHLATEWRKVEKVLPKVRMISGERHRERVLSIDEENRYLEATAQIANQLQRDYEAALEGIRATQRGQEPLKPDAFLLRDVVTLLLDTGLRPEEAFRLQWTCVRDGNIEVLSGKTANARRRIPVSTRVAAILAMRQALPDVSAVWVFPARWSKSGHVEPSSLKRQHTKACALSGVDRFDFYSLRHTFLTRMAPVMDPWSLGYIAGHSSMSITKRYVHPQASTIREAIERVHAQGGHKIVPVLENDKQPKPSEAEVIN